MSVRDVIKDFYKNSKRIQKGCHKGLLLRCLKEYLKGCHKDFYKNSKGIQSDSNKFLQGC